MAAVEPIRIPRRPGNTAVTSTLAKRIKNFFWFAMMLIVCLAVLAFQGRSDALSRFGSELVILLCIFAASAAGYVAFLVIAQRAADRDMRQELGAILEGSSARQMVLYLRSFDEAKASVFSKIVASVSNSGSMDEEIAYDPEECLGDAIEEHAHFVAVGDRLPSFGAAKLQTGDATWKQLVLSLIDRAEFIVMLPGMSEATLWELDEVVGRPDYRRKVAFIMPRDISKKRKAAWAELAARIKARHSVDWPGYVRAGCFFRLQHDATPLQAVRLEAFTDATKAAFPAGNGSLLNKVWSTIPSTHHMRAAP